MRLPITFLFVGALAFTLSGCQTTGFTPQAFASASGPTGALTHRDSGFVFPARLGTFHRVNTLQYDATGRDVSVGYNNDLPPVVATIYVYPAGNLTLEQELARRQAELTQFHPGARLESRGSTTVSPRRVRALSAEYTFTDRFAGTVQPLRSLLLVAPDGPRFVEYRFSYPAPTQGVSAALVRKLAQDFAWP